jgi:hypothetical protein
VRGLGYLAFAGAVALGMACAPLLGEAEATKDDPCAVEIVKLEGQRNLEILKACQGYTLDACPDVERINAHFDPLIQAQVRCGADR